MEAKQISCGESPSLSARYDSFIAQKLESYNKYKINELLGRQVRACFHGWVILSNHDSVLWSLWNPLTSKLIRLPPLTHKKKQFLECCLSSPPDDKGSVLLLTTPKIPTFVFCRLDHCKRKRLKWIEMSYAKQLRSISGSDCFLHRMTCCNNKIYALASDVAYEFVIQVDTVVKGKEVVITLLPFVKLPKFPLFDFQTVDVFLKGSCTELFFIQVCFKGKTRIVDVHLFKLDMTSMTWEEMEDLKDVTFFLQFVSDNASLVFYKSNVGSEIGGYVHILNEMRRRISIHVKDRIMSLSSKCGIVLESHMLVWTMLESSLEMDLPESKQQKEEGKDNETVIRSLSGDDTEFYSTTSESQLLNIPFNILEMIMDLCIGVEYMNFRATCKRCKSAAPLTKWSSKTSLRRLEMYSLVSPWLIVFNNSRGTITFTDPICGDKYFIKTPRELNVDYKIYCSRYGWLLMYEVNGLMAFFNPFTSDIRKLPVARFLQSLCFSAPPTSPDCVVVGFRKVDSGVYVHFVSQESSWRKYRFSFGSNGPYSYHFPTFSGRDVYVLCNNKRIEAFRVGEDDLSRVVIVDKAPRSSVISPSRRRCFLSKCDQHLLLVMASKSGRFVEVFKLNEITKELEKIDGLGTHMIYISDTSCICLEAKSQEMKNKIYFSRLLRNNKDTKIVFYSFETCRYHTCDDKNIQESFGVDFLITEHYCDSHTWIEPSWS